MAGSQYTDRQKLSRLSRLFDGSKTGLRDNKKGIPPKDTRLKGKVFVGSLPRAQKWHADDSEFKSSYRPGKSRIVVGGEPIDAEIALGLRKLVHGSMIHSFSSDWKRVNFIFHSLEGCFPYGLKTQMGGTRGFILAVQAYLLKEHLFNKSAQSEFIIKVPLKPTDYERRNALIASLCEILWQAGDKKRCSVCLKADTPCFVGDRNFRADGITERMHLFEFAAFDELKTFMKKNIDQFAHSSGNGCILFLYSLILSRTITKVREDMGMSEESKDTLLTDMEDVSRPLINLLLTGRAVKNFHNRDILYDQEGNLLLQPSYGIKNRSSIGFLFWNKNEEDDRRTEVGSMLKVPKYPLWVVKVNHRYGLLFSTIAELISDWRMEHLFNLYYYTGAETEFKPTILTVDTRGTNIQPVTIKSSYYKKEDNLPHLDQCILTKWDGAEVDWNGTPPFF